MLGSYHYYPTVSRRMTPDDVREIFFRRQSGQKIQEIAQAMGFCLAVISLTLRGKRHGRQIKAENLRAPTRKEMADYRQALGLSLQGI
jgi:hypothetical protein